MKAALALLVILIVAATNAIEYVDSASTCTMDCGTETDPHTDILSALDKIPTGGEIIIKAGTYSGLRNVNYTLNAGDFTISGEDPADKPVLACNTFSGGMHIVTSGKYILKNLVFQDCKEDNGGSLRMQDTTFELHGVDFEESEAFFGGGAIHMLRSTGTIFGGYFKGSSAVEGGAIYVEDGTLELRAPFTFSLGGATEGDDLYCANATINIFAANATSLPGGLACPMCEITFKPADGASTESTSICGSGKGVANTNPCNFRDGAACVQRSQICMGLGSSEDFRCGCLATYGDCIGDSKCATGFLESLYRGECSPDCESAQCLITGVDTTPLPYTKFFILRLFACDTIDAVLTKVTQLFTTKLAKTVVVKIRRVQNCDAFNLGKKKRQVLDPTVELYTELTAAEEETLATTLMTALDDGELENEGVTSVEIGPLGPTAAPAFPTTIAPTSSSSVIVFSMVLLAVLALLF